MRQMKIHKTIILPIALYGPKCWPATWWLEETLHVQKCICFIEALGLQFDWVTNEDILIWHWLWRYRRQDAELQGKARCKNYTRQDARRRIIWCGTDLIGNTALQFNCDLDIPNEHEITRNCTKSHMWLCMDNAGKEKVHNII